MQNTQLRGRGEPENIPAAGAWRWHLAVLIQDLSVNATGSHAPPLKFPHAWTAAVGACAQGGPRTARKRSALRALISGGISGSPVAPDRVRPVNASGPSTCTSTAALSRRHGVIHDHPRAPRGNPICNIIRASGASDAMQQTSSSQKSSATVRHAAPSAPGAQHS